MAYYYNFSCRVQIRRTDKLKNEAKYHHVDEYMVLVEKWYDNLEKSFPDVSRRLFLATDDPGVKQEIRARSVELFMLNKMPVIILLGST